MEAHRNITTKSPEYIELENKQPFYHWKEQPRGKKKPLWNYLKAGDWKDEPCFLIGGGPSLQGFDFAQLEGKGRIIAVNKSFFYVPFADMMVAMDQQFYDWVTKGQLGTPIRAAFKTFAGFKVWIDSNNSTMNGVEFIFRWNLPELTNTMKQGVYCGNNTGVGALALACLLGCNPILLLGYDMGHRGRKTHFHSGYLTPQAPSTTQNFIKHFEMLAGQIARKGIKVINLNRNSRLKCFGFGDINDFL